MNMNTRMVLSHEDMESVDEPPPAGRKPHRSGLYTRFPVTHHHTLSTTLLLADQRRLHVFTTLLGDGRAG